MKTKMRLLSVLLCLVMLFGLMPTSAFAAEKETIDSISATVTLPAAGANPVETGTPGDSSYKIIKVRFSEKDPETGLLTSLDSSDTFEAGKTYRINVQFRPNSGFTIDNEARATINGMNAEYWSTISDGYDSKYFGLEYTVPEEITSLYVAAPVPIAGETAGTNGITLNPVSLSISSAKWCAFRDGVGLVSVNQFTAGKTYYLVIEYDVAEGYTVSNRATILHNLNGGAAMHNSSNKTIMIEYTVAAEVSIKTPITSVKVSDVTEPIIGATPDFDVTLTGVGAELYEYEEDEWEAITWGKYNPETDEWEQLDEYTPFSAGLYCLCVALQSEEGYEFTDATKFYYYEYELPAYDGSYESNYERWDGGVDIYLYFTLEESVEMSDTEILLSSYEVDYTGKPICPTVTVKHGSKILVENEDYTVEYTDNKNIGRATVTITGKGLFSGSVEEHFDIAVYEGNSYVVGKQQYTILDANLDGTGTVRVDCAVDKTITAAKIGPTIAIGGVKFKITEIKANAFKGCTELKGATIGNAVTKIGDNAFYGCTKLVYAIGAANVQTIGNKAFYNCTSLIKYGNSNNRITVARSVSIGADAFRNCTSVTYVNLSSANLTTIGDRAFYGCKEVGTLILSGKNISTIGKNAFTNCTSLANVTVKTNVLTNVGAQSFKGINKNCTIKVPSGKAAAYKKLFISAGAPKTIIVK